MLVRNGSCTPHLPSPPSPPPSHTSPLPPSLPPVQVRTGQVPPLAGAITYYWILVLHVILCLFLYYVMLYYITLPYNLFITAPETAKRPDCASPTLRIYYLALPYFATAPLHHTKFYAFSSPTMRWFGATLCFARCFLFVHDSCCSPLPHASSESPSRTAMIQY